MLKRYLTIIGLILFTIHAAFAGNWMCGLGLDTDNQTTACMTNGDQPFCPMDAVSCIKTDSPDAFPDKPSGISQSSWLALIGQLMPFLSSPDIQDFYECPLGAQYACVDNAGAMMCSPHTCVDLEVETPIETGLIDGSMLVDDGRVDETGACLDTLYLYSGRASECKPAGVSTAFKDCCKNKGKVYFDSAGGNSELALGVSVIPKVYGVSKAAYGAYATNIAQGASQEIATQSALSTANAQLLLAFNPTTIAIAVALYYVTDYLTQACEQLDMETAMMASSGYCVNVGTYCKTKWPLLGCAQDARSYCCFNSKMARIIHEQGRPQLKLFNSWGPTGNPDCRGFTPEEFQTLDFAKIDLSEYYDDLTHELQPEIQSNIEGGINDFMQSTY